MKEEIIDHDIIPTSDFDLNESETPNSSAVNIGIYIPHFHLLPISSVTSVI